MNLEKRSLGRVGKSKATRVAGAITNLDSTKIAKDLQQSNPRFEGLITCTRLNGGKYYPQIHLIFPTLSLFRRVVA